MEILLSSGKTIAVDDESFTMVDDYSGQLTHIFTSKKSGTIYTIKDENITAFADKWVASTLDKLLDNHSDNKPAEQPDCMFG